MSARRDDFYNKQKPLTPSELGALGAAARLASGEDPAEMTRAARESANHPAKLARWLKAVREADPSLSAEEAVREAEQARRAHYAEMGRRSWEARKQACADWDELHRADAGTA